MPRRWDMAAHWLRPAIPAPAEEWTQEDEELEPSLSYTVNSKPTWATLDPISTTHNSSNTNNNKGS